MVGERLRKAVEGHRFVYEGTHIPVTISVGVAVLPNPEVKDANDIVGFADQALYKSKNGGRNRVTLYKPETVAAAPAAPVTATRDGRLVKVSRSIVFCRSG